MKQRMERLKALTKADTPDIAVYRTLVQEIYAASSDKPEILRKADFLTAFAERIPIVLHEEDMLAGSMRFWQSGAPSRNAGHIIVDYRTVLRLGVDGMRRLAGSKDTEDARAFCQALDAFSCYLSRCAATALELYEKSGLADLKEVSAVCAYVAHKPPQSFRQALQLIWAVHLFLHAEGMSAAVSFGRFDQYMYPFYKKDLEDGILTSAQAEELLMCFWLKTCEGDESQNLTLGGDNENALTYLCLSVAGKLRVQQPSLSVRLCAKSSELLWRGMMDLIKCGIGMPAIFNDSVVIRALRELGISDADAQNYGIVGCYEANPDGLAYGITAAGGSFELYTILLDFLNTAGQYTSFDDFYAEFRAYFTNRYHSDILAQFRRNQENIQTNLVSPFQSACFWDCLERGLAAERGGCRYTMFGINILGLGTLVDSLYVIRQLVFEENIVGLTELTEQMKQNFPDRQLALRCRNLPGKYGTDNELTNTLAAEISNLVADLVAEGEIAPGVIPYAGLFQFLRDVHSTDVPATPDGRFNGERVSYGVSASDICMGKTVTSVLNSAAHVAHYRFADGNPLMFNLNEKELMGEQGDVILRSLIEGYFAKGGFHLQFNMVGTEELRAAQREPDAHQDLIVRISGYSEYFTRLDEQVQTALIERG